MKRVCGNCGTNVGPFMSVEPGIWVCRTTKMTVQNDKLVGPDAERFALCVKTRDDRYKDKHNMRTIGEAYA